MTLSVPRARHYLKNFELEKLFIEELGWDRHSASLDVQVAEATYTLHAVAEKRGVQIFTCQTSDGRIPDYYTRQKIDKQVAKAAYEHLIIFIDGEKTTQLWQWVARQPGQPAAYREHAYHPQHQSGDALIQKLNAITIPLDEEEALDLTGTIQKLKDAFNRDQVTKKFYDQFKREHAAFLKFIAGITEQGDRDWYASLMLNRLMFIYFIQKKGFLDGDPSYLRKRLQTVQQRKGKGKFHTFYRYFLLTLFHEGFAKQPKDRKLDPDLVALLGEVPYLNGGLFEVHQLEEAYPKIDIPDEAFEHLFDFFDQWDWTLDTRPLRSGKEINPDVLGYIFEKYINQKEMGAYYTKEDITEYISKNTILPHLFDVAEKKCAVAFPPNAALWRLLRDDPDRYLYPAVRQGVIDEHGEVIPESTLPEFVQKGIHEPKARMFNKQYNLGQVFIPGGSGKNLALPTETWREYVTRRQRCLELREKLQSGTIRQINDLITYNLNIRQFAEDAIAGCEGPELLRAFYQAISTVTVLDPTCGSGAFLFAALNILEPLYEACLDRMQAFVEDLERSGERHSPKKFEDFRKVLAEIDRHPNRAYFILKSIIVNNLYGVDIMEEAVEICKLRLFLKLVAQVDNVKHLEPLPDIDFNIRAGNTLVGFVSLEEIRRAAEQEGAQLRLISGQTEKALRRIEEEAEIVERAFQKFHEMQTEHGMDASAFTAQKQELRKRLNKLSEELDRYLAREYGVSAGANGHSPTFEKWRKSHLPFHWFAEFYGIMQNGGFDVIIGNPPYVEIRAVKTYKTLGYACEDAGNLYAEMLERACTFVNAVGRQGFIVPVSSISTDRYQPLQLILAGSDLWYSSFDDRPSRLFDGLEHIRLTIHLIGAKHSSPQYLSTKYNKWNAVERSALFDQLVISPAKREIIASSFPKLCSTVELGILRCLSAQRKCLADFYDGRGRYNIFYSRKVGYFLQVLDFEPTVLDGKGRRRPPSEFKEVRFGNQSHAQLCLCCLNSNLFYWFITVFSDCRHVNKREVDAFPIDLDALENSKARLKLEPLAQRLMSDIAANSVERVMKFAHDTLTVQCIIPKLSKPIVDEIDAALADYYGFSNNELNFCKVK